MKQITLISIIGLLNTLLVSCGGSENSNIKKDNLSRPTTAEINLNNTEESISVSPSSSGISHPQGMRIYNLNCKVCHQSTGLGYPNTFPPLAKSDFLLDKEATIKQVLYGGSGEIVVNGISYNGTMPSFNKLSDQEVAHLLNFVYSSWGNAPTEVTPKEVFAVRSR